MAHHAPTIPTAAVPDELLHAYCGESGRGIRIFNSKFDLIWSNFADWADRFPIYFDIYGDPSAIPMAGPECNGWPVSRAFGEHGRIERIYWSDPDGEGKAQLYRVRAWQLSHTSARGALVIEETEPCSQQFDSRDRLRRMDVELNGLIQQVIDFVNGNVNSNALRLRLANPHLQSCNEIKECGREECPSFYDHENLRCWETNNTQCRDGMELQSSVEKLNYCGRCDVFLMACPDPLTRVGENLNRLLMILQAKHQEALEAQQQVQQAEKMATIGALMLGLVHEIKTPLSVIVGRLECLQMELGAISEKELVEDLNVLSDHAGRMAKVLDQVFTIARPQPPQLRPMRINETIEQTLQILRKTLEVGGVTVQTFLEPTLPLLDADPLLVQQVLVNLILNARDAMPRGGELTIQSRLQTGASQGLVVTVGDTGCGIEPERIDKIFSPFCSTKLEKGGTGLGLVICRRIMIQHGGRIEVSSEVGKGTTFLLQWPLTRGSA